ncbi:aggregation factor core [Shimia sp. SDUM112013]|uniref:aggregation factor core n=1 Tax=Shimia sp. SDUM112013 TaxID=3136160 RepID=UPI0032F09730
MRLFSAFAILATVATTAGATVAVDFYEGAPKDRFAITNQTGCALRDLELTIDLEGSGGALIFNVTGQGAGVEVFQPFEVVAGRDALTGLPEVLDGDRRVTLAIDTLGQGQTIAFTIDVDDTIGAREITVTGAEIAGASVMLRQGAMQSVALFDDAAKARLDGNMCRS